MKPSQPSLPANRVFITQLHKDANLAQGDFRGRVEHLVSYQSDYFASLEEFYAFTQRVLTAQEATDEPCYREAERTQLLSIPWK